MEHFLGNLGFGSNEDEQCRNPKLNVVNRESETNEQGSENKRLEDFLVKARTPERKNRNQLQRTSFVITSTAYKKQMEENKRAKEEIEKRKEENRQKRIQKQLEKESKGTSTNKQTDKIVENLSEEKNIIRRTGLCFSCALNITTKKLGIKCQDCTRTYHVICLKKRDLFKDFFRCAVCYLKQNM